MLTTRNKIIDDLEIHQTSCRKKVVQVFIEHSGVAFSESEIRKYLAGEFDRASIFRTVKILIQKQFIHQVICDQGILKYALTSDCKSSEDHPHFQCMECNKVFCLTETIKSINLPSGYVAKHQYVLIKGDCIKCIKPLKIIK